MPSTPSVSLLIPTFNSARTVADAIFSCISQTFTDIEILIYDEASRDETRSVLESSARRDSRIRLMYHDANSGPVRAWRKLLHAARGRWCTFVWSDDILLPPYLETLVGILRKNPTHLIVGTNCYNEYCEERPLDRIHEFEPYKPTPYRHMLHEFPTGMLKGDEYALGLLAGVFPVSQICSLFDTETAKEVFDHYIEFENPYGFDFSRHAYGNDVAFLSELALRSKELVQVGEPLVVGRGSPASMTVVARRRHRWQYWLQYIWAFRVAWTRCRHLSPRMDTLIRVADDRISFCDTFYSLQTRQRSREFDPIKFARAAWFILRHDRRMNRKVSTPSVQAWLARA